MKLDPKRICTALRSRAVHRLCAAPDGWTVTNAWIARTDLPPAARVRPAIDFRGASPPPLDQFLSGIRAALPSSPSVHRTDRVVDAPPWGRAVLFVQEGAAPEDALKTEVWINVAFAPLLDGCTRVVLNKSEGALVGLDEAGEIAALVMEMRV